MSFQTVDELSFIGEQRAEKRVKRWIGKAKQDFEQIEALRRELKGAAA